MKRTLETFARAALQALRGSPPTLRAAITVIAGAAGGASRLR